MPFPFTFPFNFDITRVLQLILKTMHLRHIVSEIDEPLDVLKIPFKPLDIDIEVTTPFAVHGGHERGLRITTSIDGGG